MYTLVNITIPEVSNQRYAHRLVTVTVLCASCAGRSASKRYAQRRARRVGSAEKNKFSTIERGHQTDG